jgi:predicted phosphodiesterase
MPARILHLSDIHFEAQFAPAVGLLLETLSVLKDERPINALVVSGDLVDSPSHHNFKKVKEWLNKVCSMCDLDVDNDTLEKNVIVVPGNHDYGFKGVLGLPSITGRHFHKHFSAVSNPHVRHMPHLNVTFFRLDSNRLGVDGARGRIGLKQLNQVQAQHDALGDSEKEKIKNSTKIAVIHHHPFSIPFTPSDRFLMLANPQYLLDFLTRNHIDLVLHGHKHVAPHSWLKLGTTASGVTTVVEVLGAGTAFKKEADQDPRGYNFNLIDIEANGLRFIRQFFAAAGEGFQEAHDFESFYEQLEIAHKNAKQQCNFAMERLEAEKVIDEEGDSSDEFRITSLTKAQEPYIVKHELERGHFGHLAVKSAGSINVSEEHLIPPSEHPRVREFEIHFSDTPKRDRPASFTVSSQAFNAFSTSLEEFKRKFPKPKPGQIVGEEWAERPLDKAVDHFYWTISFAKAYGFSRTPQFEVRDAMGKRHEFLTKALQPSFDFSPTARVAHFHIHAPPTGYTYRIFWNVKDVCGQVENLAVKNQTHLLRTKLLDLQGAIPSLTPRLKKIQQVLSAFCHLVVRKLNEDLHKDPRSLSKDIVKAEQLETSLMVYDDDKGQSPAHLKIVAAVNADKPQLQKFVLEIGDGNAGRAYKKNMIRFFDDQHASQDNRKRGTYIPLSAEGQSTPEVHKFLYSLPLRHPEDQKYICAILNIGTFDSMHGYLLATLNSSFGYSFLLDIAQEYVLRRLFEICEIWKEQSKLQKAG